MKQITLEAFHKAGFFFQHVGPIFESELRDEETDEIIREDSWSEGRVEVHRQVSQDGEFQRYEHVRTVLYMPVEEWINTDALTRRKRALEAFAEILEREYQWEEERGFPNLDEQVVRASRFMVFTPPPIDDLDRLLRVNVEWTIDGHRFGFKGTYDNPHLAKKSLDLLVTNYLRRNIEQKQALIDFYRLL
jgi:hypothetical protein